MHGSLAVVLNRKGRKRKSGRREPSGRCARAPVDYRAMAARNPDRIGLPEALRTHERAGSSLGRLNLKKRISDHEFEAGQRYSVIVGVYRAMIGVPQGLSGGSRAAICWGIAPCPSEACVCLARKNRYDDAYCSIRTHAAHLAVNAVAIHDHDISPDQLVYLREGLSALARHFGLTGSKRT